VIFIPTATFLAGALLSLLLPVGLLIALATWYVMFIRRLPETAEGQEPLPPDAVPGASPESRED
jgi:hypothetical protein